MNSDPRIQNLLPRNSHSFFNPPLPLFKVNLFIFSDLHRDPRPGGHPKEVLVPVSLPSWNPLLDHIPASNLQTIGHRRVHPVSEMREGLSGGSHPSGSPSAYRQQDCISCFKCLECLPKAVSFRVREAPMENRGARFPVQEVCPGLPRLWFLFSADDQNQPPSDGERSQVNNRLIRPPGSLPEEEFVYTCTGCGECLKVCPNNALQSTLLEAGLAGLYTPRLVPRIGYCEEMCNFCGQVCPTEAIRHITMEEKRLIQIGVAHIDKTRCIAWDTDKICLVCNEQCSYQAIIGDDKKRPIVREEKCTGCGICENKCPVDGEAAIIVHASGVQKKLTPEPGSNGNSKNSTG